MCRIDDAERCAVWNQRDLVARAPHVCSECRRTIERGEPYRRIGWLFDGGWSTSKICAHCRIGADWLNAECSGHMADGVREEILEHAEEYRDVGLWRLTAGMERKWQRFDGAGLMPVPKMPPVSEAHR